MFVVAHSSSWDLSCCCGHHYTRSLCVISLFCCTYIVNPSILPFTIDLIQNVGLSILQAMNRYDSRARVYFCTGLLNLFLAIPLAIRFGGIGCAFATGLSMFLGNGVVMNWFYKKHIGLDIPGFWRQIGQITIPVLFCLGIVAAGNEWIAGTGKIVFVGKALGYMVLYGVVIYKLAMNEEEKIRGIAGTVRRI